MHRRFHEILGIRLRLVNYAYNIQYGMFIVCLMYVFMFVKDHF